MNQANGGNVIYKFLGDTKDLDGKIKGVKGALGGIGAVAGIMGGAVMSATTAVAGGLYEITKESVKLSGEFEQLAGGAQKIFDEMDYDKIAQDARNAYNTMNLSASQYLALINDVGATFASTMGDEKGYNTAKQGLQAISDYASGTGKNVDLLGQKFTMITRSTSSYQSIADQFSGVLPATSQAFLEQAQACGLLSQEYTKLTEVPIEEYQQAVSGMLEKGVANLGLANNTLTESTQTLTGSIASAQSAIQNFLSGSGGFEEVVDTVVIAGQQISKKIIELLPQIVEGIVGIINGLIPQIPPLVEKLLPVVTKGLVDLMQGLVQVAPTLITTLAGMIPDLVNAFVDIFVSVSKAFAEQAPVIMPIVVEALVDALCTLFENVDVIIEATLALMFGLIDGIVECLPILVDKAPIIVQAILKGLIKSLPVLLNAGVTLVKEIIKGISYMPGNLISTGKNIIQGIWNGIKNFDIVGKIKDLAKSMLKGMKKVLGIHSPSTEFAWLGEMSMKGYTNQLEDMKGMLDNVIEDTFSINPQLSTGNLHYSPNVIVNNNISNSTDSLGQTVTNIKTFANGAKNDYNYGMGV